MNVGWPEIEATKLPHWSEHIVSVPRLHVSDCAPVRRLCRAHRLNKPFLLLCFCQFSLRSCIFGFPAPLLHPNVLISNCRSPFTTRFYQLFSQSTTKQREWSHAACAPTNTARNIVHELLLISIPQCYRQTILSIRSGRGHGANRGRNAVGRKYCSAMTQK